MRIVAFAFAFIAGPAFAQVQRCDSPTGPVFQQGPCAGAERTALAAAPAPAAANGASLGAGKQLCKEMAAITFGDAARIVVVRRWGTEVVKFRGARETAITYELSIDERTQRNGYRGARQFYCFVDASESRVFRIAAPLRRQSAESGF